MSVTAYSGPVVQYGVTLTSTGGNGITGIDTEHNDQRAPIYHDLSHATLDPRQAYAYNPGSGVTNGFGGFFQGVGRVDYVPITANASAFVSNSVVSSGVTTYTLNAGSSSGGTYTTTIVAPETGKVSETLVAIDSTAAYLTFGSAGTARVWNPNCGPGRCVSITTSSSGDAGTFSIAGRDMYGYKMTETVALSQGASNSSGFTVTSQKAFKYVSSITNTTTPKSTGVSIGFSDLFGFPILVPYIGQNATIALSSNSFTTGAASPSSASVVLASTIATQTSTTPDVRGTYKSTTASNGTLRLQMSITMTASGAAAITSTNVAPWFGQTNFSSF